MVRLEKAGVEARQVGKLGIAGRNVQAVGYSPTLQNQSTTASLSHYSNARTAPVECFGNEFHCGRETKSSSSERCRQLKTRLQSKTVDEPPLRSALAETRGAL
jgi:hypothetical protein